MPNSPQGSVFADLAAQKYPQLKPGLSVVVMNYMDAMNVDLARLKECSMDGNHAGWAADPILRIPDD